MKRLLQHLLVVTLLAAGGLCTTAQAQYPNHVHRNYAAAPNVVVYAGNAGYGNGYGGYTNNYNNFSGGYGGGYYGYAPAVPLYPQTAPYGAGYSGGWRPYQDMYLQRLYYGLGN